MPQSLLTDNVASYLPKMAQEHGDTVAVYFPKGKEKNGQTKYLSYTYRELNDQSDLIAKGLADCKIGLGSRVVLMVPPSLEFFTLVFAIFKSGATMVCVDPGMGVKNLRTCIDQAKPDVFIGVPKAHLARKIFKWGKSTIKRNIVVGKSKFRNKGNNLDAIRIIGEQSNHVIDYTVHENQVPAILFTSGSTGIPKGVIYTHQNFMAQVLALKDEYNITHGEVDLATFPLFALYAPVLGMTAVIPHMNFTRPGSVNPKDILEPIERFMVTNMFGSPALLNRVGIEVQEKNIKLPTLKRILSAGAPVPARVMRLFEGKLNKGVHIHTPYGATESLPVASMSSDLVLDKTEKSTEQGMGVCVGHVVGKAKVQIIKITETPIFEWEKSLELGENEIGEIIVKGPCVTMGYDQMENQTNLAKIHDGKTFYHRMGDLGYFDNQKRLWFCGRKSHRVITEDHIYYSVSVEGVFNAHPSVFRSALVRLNILGKVEAGICIELEPHTKKPKIKILSEELLEIASRNPVTSGILHIFYHHAFPVDIRHNAKINREKLSRWAQKRIK